MRGREKRLIAAGLCTSCGKHPAREQRRTCECCAEKQVGINKRSKLRTTYGLSLDEAREMLRNQGGGCALCYAPLSLDERRDRKTMAHVDHDHLTGAVRALLCNTCNVGLGSFRDDPRLLRKAATYVEEHRSRAGEDR